MDQCCTHWFDFISLLHEYLVVYSDIIKENRKLFIAYMYTSFMIDSVNQPYIVYEIK